MARPKITGAGLAFKILGILGFVCLTLLLVRLIPLPTNSTLTELLPNFMLLLLSIIIIALSFILVALGRLIELSAELKYSQLCLEKIAQESEKIRIESQYIYEVQKDLLMSLVHQDKLQSKKSGHQAPSDPDKLGPIYSTEERYPEMSKAIV
ncbi:MAG: hypothetical protein R2880_03510 [Deinococcales bacterium]